MLLSLALGASLQTAITLVHAPIPEAEVVSVQVFFRAGSAYESASEAGVTHLVEHSLFRRGVPGSLDAEVERLGGRLDATTYRDLLRIWCTVPKEHALRAAEALRKALAPLSMNEAVLDAEKRMVLQELRLQSMDNERVVFDLLWQSLGGKGPYARPTGGMAETVQALGLPRVLEWSQRCLHRRGMALVVSGATSAEEAARIRDMFDNLPDGEGLIEPPTWPSDVSSYSIARTEGVLGVGLRAPPPTTIHPYAAWMVAWEVLAGSDGVARQAGLTCRAKLDPTGAGTLAVLLFSNASEDAISTLLRSSGAKNPTDAQITVARSIVAARWAKTLTLPEERGFWEGAMRLWGGPPPQDLLQAVQRCAPEEVRAVLQSIGGEG